jgi:hypothetical protein
MVSGTRKEKRCRKNPVQAKRQRVFTAVKDMYKDDDGTESNDSKNKYLNPELLTVPKR